METWDQKNFDVIVIGTGPGGATIARELTRQGKKVLILERGSNSPVKGTFLQSLGMNMVPGKSLLFTEELLGVMRGITTGGSSIAYYACALELPYAAFESHGIDLTPEVEAVKQELPIAPLADSLVGPAAWRNQAHSTCRRIRMASTSLSCYR